MERTERLKGLAATVKKLEEELNQRLVGYRDLPKWQWPAGALEIVGKMRQQAKDNNRFLRESLDPLLAWPNKEAANAEAFYGAAPPFDRTKDWFEKTMGFNKYQTPYTFSDRWDKAELMTTFLVPSDLNPGDECPIMWFIHGGGFCTGASDHIPWYSKASLEHAKRHKAIVIAPDYPLGPEGNYADIGDSMYHFLKFYDKDGCFEKGESHWTQWLIKKIDKEGVRINKDQVFVEGESAGAHAAVTTMFLNAAEGLVKPLPIKAALLRYPMLAHYKRDFTKGELEYMGYKVSEQEATKQAQAIINAIGELEEFGLVPTRSTGLAPQYMAPAFLLSTTKNWEQSFVRVHGRQLNRQKDWAGSLDCLERAKQWKNRVNHEILPPIVMYHGYDDSNCPYEDAETFKTLLISHYPKRYVDNETIFLEKVTELFEKNGVKSNHSDVVAHGFDYALSEEHEPFLKRAYERVDMFWPERK